MSTLAVLLIIGSAVVGPIEAQNTRMLNFPIYSNCIYESNVRSTSPAYDTTVAQCSLLAWGNPDEANKRTLAPLETLPQLCERAMREVGALRIFSDSKGGIMWAGITIRCLQVPQGYRR